MKVAFVVYPDFTALDLVGPYEVIGDQPVRAAARFGREVVRARMRRVRGAA